jgi:dipeptidyl aminopeptidase/acylaminoacyl peptidase
MPITLKLVEDGNDHLLLDRPVPFAGPVRLLHGQRDPDVPWQIALRVAEQMESGDVRVILIKDGDHRLSRPQDIALIVDTANSLIG